MDGGASGVSTPSSSTFRKAHKFFDSYPQYERREADIYANNNTPSKLLGLGSLRLDTPEVPQPKVCYCIPPSNVIDSAHYGYIYCMAPLGESDHGFQFVTGSGDESVKVRHRRLLSSKSKSTIGVVMQKPRGTISAHIFF